jgi:dTDP-3-amino-3,4,6-trideoxy-alpha-D-glucose transaminase
LQSFAEVLDSGRFVAGPALEAFEASFAAYCGVRHGIGVGNGLDALYLALKASGIGAGDEVLVPAHTFVATWLAITRCNATPVPVEPDPRSCVVTAEGFAQRLTKRTRAVVAVSLYGSLQGMPEIASLCRERGLLLLEDAAQAHGARLGTQVAGSFGTAAAFSFYPTKNLGCLGDGGMVVTNDAQLARTVRALRNYGGHSRYSHELEGVNSRLDEMQAALLAVRLPKLDAANAHRQALARIYTKRLAGLPLLELPPEAEPGSHVWHLFVIRTRLREDLQQFLAERGIETLVHYPRAVYRLPPFLAFAPDAESVADRLAATVLSLPMGPHLQEQDVHAVCDAIQEFVSSAPHGYRK